MISDTDPSPAQAESMGFKIQEEGLQKAARTVSKAWAKACEVDRVKVIWTCLGAESSDLTVLAGTGMLNCMFGVNINCTCEVSNELPEEVGQISEGIWEGHCKVPLWAHGTLLACERTLQCCASLGGWVHS